MQFKIIWFLIALECHRTFGIGLRLLILEAHNRRRAKYGNQPMVLDNSLSEGCSKYAQQILLSGGEYREYYMPSQDKNEYIQIVCIFRAAFPRICVRKWFHYRGFGNNEQYYKFTAMIWNASTRLGVGLSRKMETRYLVVRYAPPGNILSEMELNVPKRKKNFWDEEEIWEHEDYPMPTSTEPSAGPKIFRNWIFFITSILINLRHVQYYIPSHRLFEINTVL
ncbi:ectin isoform X2 [Drosophila eugracilis]|uniref:ectin isoform X2 n=1 Tax=Drosophila eugracilis TaxID=29029 RepID=UPI0007E8A4E9|nr:ectin isoform X2 [Drosophila eugracilis]